MIKYFVLIFLLITACVGDATDVLDNNTISDTKLEMPKQEFKGITFKLTEQKESELQKINKQLKIKNLEAKPLFPNARPQVKNWNIKKKLGMDQYFYVETENVEEVEEILKGSNAESINLYKEEVPTLIPSDPLFSEQWHHQNTGSNSNGGIPGADISSPEAWDVSNAGVLVANLEAFQWWHEDIIDNMWTNLGEDADHDGKVIQYSATEGRYIYDPGDINGLDDDNNGYPDDFVGIKAGDWDETHGTFTATTLMASKNNKGGVGVCYNCKLISARDHYSVGYNWEEYVIDQGAKVVSRSVISGYTSGFVVLMDYAEALNVNFVYAAGNDAIEDENEVCKDEYVLCVAGTDENDNRASFSSYGNLYDVAAPAYAWGGIPGNQYVYEQGTSISAPLVAGVVALIKAENPGLTGREVNSIVISTADPLSNQDYYIGNGRLNAQVALQKARNVNSFPVGYITGNYNLLNSEIIDLNLTAYATRFSKWELYYGEGIYPSNWNFIDEGFSEIQNLIYSWDTGNLPQGTYQLQLRVIDNNNEVGIQNFVVNTKKSLQLLSGYPLGSNVDEFFVAQSNTGAYVYTVSYQSIGTELYSLQVNGYKDGILDSTWPLLTTTWTSTPYHKFSVVDLDNDGNDEIILTYRQSANPSDHAIKIFDNKGNIIREWLNLNWYNEKEPMFANLDMDSDYEIFVSDNANIIVYDIDGSIRSFSTPSRYGNIRMTYGDFDADGQDEIFYANLINNNYNVVGVEGDGTLIGTFFTSSNDIANSVRYIYLLNYDSDKQLELVVHQYRYFYLIDNDGTTIKNWRLPRDNSILHIAEMYDNTKNFVFIRAGNYFVYDLLGNVIFEGISPANDFTGLQKPINLISNMDSDMELEFFNEMVFNIDKSRPNPTISDGINPILLDDVNNDGFEDLLRIQSDKTLAAWDVGTDNYGSRSWLYPYHDKYNSNNFDFYCTEELLNNQCLTQLPKACMNGNIIDNCNKCGCPSGKTCQTSGLCLDSSGSGKGGGYDPTNP